MKPQWVATVASVGALGGLLLGAGLPVLREPQPVEPIKVIVPATDERPRAAGDDRRDENVREGDDSADDHADNRGGQRDDAADDDSDGAADDDSDGAPQRNPVSGGGDDDTAADDGDDHDGDGDD